MRLRLQRIEEIIGIQSIFKIIVDDECPFDKFCTEIENEGTYVSELDSIQARLEHLANNRPLPKQKFRDITPKKEKHKEYEIKTKNLRIYLCSEKHTGKIIVLGGKKNTQQRDLKKFRSIKKEYFKS